MEEEVDNIVEDSVASIRLLDIRVYYIQAIESSPRINWNLENDTVIYICEFWSLLKTKGRG